MTEESNHFEIPSTCILHIASKDDWEQAMREGEYRVKSLTTQGFIHFSLPSQLIEVANYLYVGRNDLVLLYVDEERIKDGIRYEKPEGVDEAYPHLYNPLPLVAVVGVSEFLPGEGGLFTLPDNLKEP